MPPETVRELLRDPMRPWKLAGLALFTVGGVLLAVSLLVPTCANCFAADSDAAAGLASEFDSPSTGEPPIRIYPTGQQLAKTAAEQQTEQRRPTPLETSYSKKGVRLKIRVVLTTADSVESGYYRWIGG